MREMPCENETINKIVDLLCKQGNEGLIPLCEKLCNIFDGLSLQKLPDGQDFASNELDPEHGDIFDPEHGDIFDPEHGDIFDPSERFEPEDGIILKSVAEGLYDSYGNRIHPKDSEAVILKLLAYIIKWKEISGTAAAAGE